MLASSPPRSISIPAIGVHSVVQSVGMDPDGIIEVPPLDGSPQADQAAWYRYSPTPGQFGSALVEGHRLGGGGTAGVLPPR
ncbi:MAG: hypothetical protein ACR2JQ_07710 [Mycobacteriales bacterium]